MSDPGCYCARAGLGFSCLASSGELCQMTGMLPMPSEVGEFLLRVRPCPEGGFVATCQWPAKPGENFIVGGDHVGFCADGSEGHGRTALAAMINALMNGQVQDYTETRVS